jgi:PAS domain S-box-containing protein/putative nucleotidyltransferase with HDIG domain
MNAKKILIVEDERIIAEDIKRISQHLGYNVIDMVSSGEKALALMQMASPDLILMDIHLEGKLTGIETAEKIYNDYHLPVVYLTAYADEQTLLKARFSEPFGYILKPFDEKELHATIEMAFYKHKMEQALRDSEHFLRKVVDSDPNLIYVKDETGKYVMINRSLSSFLGVEPAQLIGKTDLDLVKEGVLNAPLSTKLHAEDIGFIQKSFVPQKIEEIVHTNANLTRWFQISRVPISHRSNPNCVLCVIEDITKRKQAEERLKRSNEKLKKLLEETVNGLVSAVEMRDPYTAGHQRRVSRLATAIARDMGLDANKLDGLRMAGLLHDIGKMYVPTEILTKPGRLSEVEFNLIKIHPSAGYEILKKIEFPWPVAEIVLQHHELLDGSGYPNKLKGDAICLEAKIIIVADIIESMSSHRPYRATLGIYPALKEITRYRGVLYDETVVDICVKLFNENRFEF